MKPVGLDRTPGGHCNAGKGHWRYLDKMSEVEAALMFPPSWISLAGRAYFSNYLCGSKNFLGTDIKEQSLTVV